MRRIQYKEEGALKLLYDKYGAALLHIILRITPSKELAEEILQDVFVKIWKKASQYNAGKGRLFTWMAQIARNTAIDATRLNNYKKESKTESIEIIVNKNEPHDDSITIEDVGLKRVVGKLEENQRQLIDYLYFRDFTQKETSEALGIPLGTVKTRARMAIKALRQVLGQELISILIIINFGLLF